MPLLVEAGWGGLVQAPHTITWTDITPYVDVIRQGVVINRGAADELSETQPGTAALRLDNTDGRFTPGNSASPYAPFVRRNAPIRISVAVIPTRSGSAPYPLAMLGDDFDDNRINTTLWPGASNGATEVGGRARVPLTPGVGAGYQSAREWTLHNSRFTAKLATVPAHGGSSVAAAGMYVNSITAGTRLGWRYDAVTGNLIAQNQAGFSDAGAVSIAYSAISHVWLRVRESAGTVYWETSGDGFGWTVQRTLATPSWVTTQTQVADFPTSRTGGTGDYIEWDLVGAEVRPRFWGQVNAFPVDWEGLVSTVPITATDLFKRLNRLPALRSMLGEEIRTLGPVVYYPLGEDSASVTAGDIGGSGVTSLATTQAGTGGTLTMGSVEGPAETGEQAPLFTPASTSNGKYLTADLGAAFQSTVNATYMAVEAWFTTTTTDRVIFSLRSPDGDYQVTFALESGTGKLQVTSLTPSAGSATSAFATPNLADGAWHQVVLAENLQSAYVDGTEYGFGSYATMHDIRSLSVGAAFGTRLWSGSIAHVAVYTYSNNAFMGDDAAAHAEAGMTGYAGEDAAARIQRLARYAGLDSVTVWGSTHDSIASQGPGGSQVVARMREVESTESGRLFVERDWYGLAYQSRDVRYNPDPLGETFTIDYADLETSQVSLADDDQKLVNSIEASRPGGATQKITAPASILAFGIYDPGSLSILKTSDNSVLDAAYWRVSRYANPSPELREVAVEAYTMPTYLDLLDADISSYFSVTNMPSQAPTSSVRVTVEGYTETIKEKSHVIQFHTSATNNDSVWVLDDSTYSVLDSTTRLAY